MKNRTFAKIIMVTGVLGLTACGGSDRDETGNVPPEPVADAMVQKSVEELTLLDVNNLSLNAASIQILSDEEWQKVQASSLKMATDILTVDDSEQLFPPINSLPTATHFKGQSYLANAQGRKRTAWQAEQPPFLLPFVRLWFPTVRMTEWMRRTKPTIPMLETTATGSMATAP